MFKYNKTDFKQNECQAFLGTTKYNNYSPIYDKFNALLESQVGS
jgi:hypothetical protein